jgi:hypothetical protein
MVNCFFSLSTYLILSVNFEKYFLGLRTEFVGKTVFSFSLCRNDGKQLTVTSGETHSYTQINILVRVYEDNVYDIQTNERKIVIVPS